MPLRLAFAGFRHGHIFDLYQRAQQDADFTVVAAAEDDAATREALARAGNVKLTHTDCLEMLSTVECDAVAVGDYYARRGPLLLAALRLGRHVIADKPLCTRLEELAELEVLAQQRKLKVGCMLDLRGQRNFLAARQLILGGEIGDVQAVSFNGQHPLMYGTRPGWYFEDGKHGGTLNDIAIHALDAIPWITGKPWRRVLAARGWNARLRQAPAFQDAAQCMLELDNGAGVLGDVSYLTPDSFKYTLAQYWRMTFWGERGMLETSLNLQGVQLCRDGETAPRLVEPPAARAGAYLRDFLADIRGEPLTTDLNTAAVLTSARVSLRVQEAADQELTNVQL